MEGWVGLAADSLHTTWSPVNHRSGAWPESPPATHWRPNHWAMPPYCVQRRKWWFLRWSECRHCRHMVSTLLSVCRRCNCLWKYNEKHTQSSEYYDKNIMNLWVHRSPLEYLVKQYERKTVTKSLDISGNHTLNLGADWAVWCAGLVGRHIKCCSRKCNRGRGPRTLS